MQRRVLAGITVLAVGSLLTASRFAGDWFGRADQARLVISQSLPALKGEHLTVKVVEVTYGPGESSPAHSHPCPVIGYVAEGAYRLQVKGQPESVYTAGQSFYEPPNGVHQVSANASKDQPVKFTATFVCDSDVPLSGPPKQ